jgi:hypothetical protein
MELGAGDERPATLGMDSLDGIDGLCGETLAFLSSREEILSGWRSGSCIGEGIVPMEEVRGGCATDCRSSGGGTSTIWGTDFLSDDIEMGTGGDFGAGTVLFVSDILGMLILRPSPRFMTASNVLGTDEFKVAGGGDVSLPAGLEKLVVVAFEDPDVLNVSARFGRSNGEKLGMAFTRGAFDSDVPGLLDSGPVVATLLAARCAYVLRSVLLRPFRLPPLPGRLYVVLVDLLRLEPGTEGRMISPVSSSTGAGMLSLASPVVLATRCSSSCRFV